MNKRIIYSITALIILIILLIVPIKIPYTITVPGKVIALKEWTLSKGTDGRLISVLKDNENGLSNEFSVSQFERGDAVCFRLKNNLATGCLIKNGDTIASVYSNEIDRRYAILQGDLEVARASLALNKSGDKEAVIKQETENLNFMQKQAEEQLKLFKRIESLYYGNLASRQEYEVAKGTADLNQINIKIAEAKLREVQTGSKPEELHVIETQIHSLENQIEKLQQKYNSYIIRSSINGQIKMTPSGDTILIAHDVSRYIIIMPLKWEYKEYLAKGQSVKLSTGYTSQLGTAELKEFDNSVKIINGTQVFAATANCTSIINSENIASGLLVECCIQCGSISPYEYLKRILKTLFV